MKRVLAVVGARPNFMKVAPVRRACTMRGIQMPLVHTGQHYDGNMSTVFLQQLGISDVEYQLEIKMKDSITQEREMMIGLQKVYREVQPEAVLVVGDVLSSMAAAETAFALDIPVIHVEAGLRSGRIAMAEERHRIWIDHHSDWLFVTEQAALINLRQEKVHGFIHMVGNVMIDSMRYLDADITESRILTVLNLQAKSYLLLTLHRAELVDDELLLRRLWSTLNEVAKRTMCVFPMHPRTRQRCEQLGLLSETLVRVIDPLSYLDMQQLMRNARGVLTDSGGVQEETTVWQVPCATMREETERPVTVELGTNEVVGYDYDRIMMAVERMLAGEWRQGMQPPLWDGQASERIANILLNA